MLTTRSPRRRAVRVCLALVAGTALTSCGFDYATDRDYTVATGVSDRSGQVDVLGAVIVSGTEGEGTFVATLSNSDIDEPATFDALTSNEGTALSVAEFEPIEIAAGGLVNLALNDVPVKVTGEFAAGNFVEVSVGFGSGESSLMQIPVVPDTGYYEGLDLPAPPETTTDATPTEDPTEG